MANYRRWRVAGGSYFFTLVAHSRAPIFTDAIARSILGAKLRECGRVWPYQIDAIVLLPEHLHAIWTLPRGDDRYSLRWAWIKKEFTRCWLEAGGQEQPVSQARANRRDRGIWQPRFWEHVIRDDIDFDRHFDYVHYNPIKHGLVSDPADWRESSIHRWIAAKVYEPGWGRVGNGLLTFDDLNETEMELEIA